MERNYWKIVTIILTIIITTAIIVFGIPGFVVLMTTPRIINVDTESQWIGFWGNYLGALIGSTISGLITLYVMFTTFKDNKKSLDRTIKENNENLKITLRADNEREAAKRKKEFDDDVLESVINYQLGVLSIIKKFERKIKDNGLLDSSTNLFAMAEVLKVKLKSHSTHSEYKHCDELYESIENVSKELRKYFFAFRTNDEKGIENSISLLTPALNDMRKTVVKYYEVNQGN